MVAIIEHCYNLNYGKVKLEQLISQTSKRNKGNNINHILSISNKLGFISQSDQFEDRVIASDDTSNYKIVGQNDFAYNPARINVGSIARLKESSDGIVSPMYVCFSPKKSILPAYLEYYFDTLQFKYEMQKRLEGSVRLCLSYEGLCNIAIPLPPLDKQRCIAERLEKLSQKIAIEESFARTLSTQKSYLLQQMFI